MTDPNVNPGYGQNQQAPYGQNQYGPYPQAPYGQQPQAPYGQNQYGPYPQAPYGQQPQAPYGQQPQAPYVNSGIPNAPVEKDVREDEPRRAPVISIIFMFLAANLLIFRYVMIFANGNTGAANILYFMMAIGACVLMILGLLIPKKQILYGIGLLVFALSSLVDFVQALLSSGDAADASMNFFLLSAFTLAGLYYVLKGKGIKKGLKLVACIIGLVFELSGSIVLFTTVMNHIPSSMRALFATQVFVGMAAFMLIWIATLIFTPFGRKKR